MPRSNTHPLFEVVPHARRKNSYMVRHAGTLMPAHPFPDHWFPNALEAMSCCQALAAACHVAKTGRLRTPAEALRAAHSPTITKVMSDMLKACERADKPAQRTTKAESRTQHTAGHVPVKAIPLTPEELAPLVGQRAAWLAEIKRLTRLLASIPKKDKRARQQTQLLIFNAECQAELAA